MISTVIYVILVILALFLGYFLGRMSIKSVDGNLFIDSVSSEDKDIYRLSLEKAPEEYSKKTLIVLKVVPNAKLEEQ